MVCRIVLERGINRYNILYIRNLSMKLVNFVTRANNLGLDSTTIFVTASGVFSFPGISYTSFCKHGISERVSRFAVKYAR